MSNVKYQISNIKKEEGFTLLELLIVFSIITILSGLGIASFVNFNKSQLVSDAASQVGASLQLARSRTLSLVKPDQGVCLTNPLDGYRVDIVIASGTYRVIAVCGGFDYNIPNQLKNLPVGVSFRNTTTTTSVYFRVLRGGVVGAGQIDVTGYNQTKSVTIDSVGKIRVI